MLEHEAGAKGGDGATGGAGGGMGAQLEMIGEATHGVTCCCVHRHTRTSPVEGILL